MAAEIPSGVIDGTNAVFTTVANITNEQLFVDRVLQLSSIDYTAGGNTITFLAGAIPQVGATIRIFYTAANNTPSIGQPGVTTLALIRQQIRERTDMVTTEFVTDAELTQYINASYYELYDLIVEHYGDDYYAALPYQFSTLQNVGLYPLPPDFYKSLGLDLQWDATSPDGWLPLRKFNFVERGRYAYPYVQGSAIVRGHFDYRIIGSNVELKPTPTAAYNLLLTYVPRLTALVNDADTVDGISGWEEYIVVDCCIKALAKEKTDTRVFEAQKAGLRARIDNIAANRDAGEPNTVGESNAGGFSGYGPGGMGGFGGGRF